MLLKCGFTSSSLDNHHFPHRRFVVYISLSPICQRTYETFVSRFQRYYYFFIFQKKLHLFFVPRVGFEPTTHRLEICCSIQLSYRGIYVFLIKYNKKIKNCFFSKNSRVSHDFKDTILF